ncbi:MAG: response regulator [Deltaproteobacteria bacterium]|nr:response regulator [Deltaproteobacteria bacterium]
MKKEKVLIVEDEMDLLDLVDFNLTRKGFVTAGALDGLEAMEKLDSFNPDIMVLDLMLPKLDGWEICRRLRRGKRNIPVIMLTAKCMPEDKVKGLEAGANDYVTKPFNIKELIIRIENLLEKKRDMDLQRMLIHEMSNRVSAIGGYSRMLSKNDGTLGAEKESAYLRSISRQVNYTTELISEVNALIEAESGELSIKTEICDVPAIAARVSESYRHMALEKGITMTFTADETVPAIEANHFAIKQVFTNLIGNAVKYCGHGGRVEVFVKAALNMHSERPARSLLRGQASESDMDASLHVEDSPQLAAGSFNGVFVSVSDDGPGIPPDDLPYIFDKGYRARNALEGAGGSGLGLYIVKTLLEKMGATITFGSVEGEGSVFAVYFEARPRPCFGDSGAPAVSSPSIRSTLRQS